MARATVIHEKARRCSPPGDVVSESPSLAIADITFARRANPLHGLVLDRRA
jgi:hypothetical protein